MSRNCAMVWIPTCVYNTASFFYETQSSGGQISKQAMTVINLSVTIRVERKRNEQRGGTHDITVSITLY